MLVYIYYVLMLTCFAVSLFNLTTTRINLLAALLAISIVAEILVEIIGKKKDDFFIVYHFFIITEYTLSTLILRTAIFQMWLRRVMLFSIPLFIILSLYISFSFYHLQSFPSINANIESAFLIGWCLFVFISIQPSEKKTIFRQSIFWINLAFFIYFISTIPYDSIYNFLIKEQSRRARDIFTYINSFPNYMLYILLTIGIILSKNERRSIVSSY